MCLQGPLGIQSGPGGGQELLEVRVVGGGVGWGGQSGSSAGH